MAESTSLKPRPRPNPSTPTHNHGHGPSSLTSPYDGRSPATSHTNAAITMQRDASKRSLAASAMQRTGSGRLDPHTPGSAGKTPAGKTPAGKTPEGKTIPGKGLTVEQLQHAAVSSRPSTPSVFGMQGFSFGSPALGQQPSPAIGSTPGTINLNILPGLDSPALAAGGVDMGLSLSNMSNIGMGASMSLNGSLGSGIIDDRERRKRLDKILEIIGKRPGRINREAVERLARSCEMQVYKEDSEDRISLAGKKFVLVDIQYKSKYSPYAEHVGLTLATDNVATGASAASASKILTEDLSPPLNSMGIAAKLDKFADNLERLAKMDKLSVKNANCFDAVHGLFSSLERLYENEKEAVQASLASSKNNAPKCAPSIEVMCTKSGRPRMHVGGRVGLSLEYWQSRRHVSITPRKSLKRKADAMEMEHAAEDTEQKDKGGIHSLIIECEYSSPALYPPFRISQAWISKRIMKPAGEVDQIMGVDGAGPSIKEKSQTSPPTDSLVKVVSGDSEAQKRPSGAELSPARPLARADETIEWLDPVSPLALAPATNTIDAAMELDENKPPPIPHARFVAHFEPPVVLPLQVASQAYAYVGLDMNQESVGSGTFDGLLLPHTVQPPTTQLVGATENCRTVVDRTVPESDEVEATYRLSLSHTRSEPSIRIAKLPFSHPRQLVSMLPTLRQYTFVASLLQNSFPSSTSVPDSSDDIKSTDADDNLDGTFPSPRSSPDVESDNIEATESDLISFLASDTTSIPHQLDASFTLVPEPSIDLSFPTSTGLRYVRLAFGLNGQVAVCDENLFDEGKSETEAGLDAGSVSAERLEKRRKLAIALSVAEDLAIWVSWVRGVVLDERGEGCRLSGEKMEGVEVS